MSPWLWQVFQKTPFVLVTSLLVTNNSIAAATFKFQTAAQHREVIPTRSLKLVNRIRVSLAALSDPDCQSGCPLPHFASQNSGILEGLGRHGVRDWHD